jgi:ABC-type glycerol-3-phosphate transport system substrate-binding protein
MKQINKYSPKITSFLLCFYLLFSCVPSLAAEESSGTQKTETDAGEEVICSKTALENWVNLDFPEEMIKVDFSSVLLNGTPTEDNEIAVTAGDAFSFRVSFSEEESYHILFQYRPINSAAALDSLLYLTLDDGEPSAATLQTLWTDARRHQLDRSGNEVIPDQTNPPQFYRGYLLDYSDVNKKSVCLRPGAGEHTVVLQSEVFNFEISAVYFVPVQIAPSYDETVAGRQIVPGNDEISFEAEEYAIKSDSYIRGKNVQNSSLSPYKTEQKKINTLYGGSWNKAGQKVLWEFNIETAGWYRIGIKYQQSSNINTPVFRTVEIDGKIPFSEWENLRFKSTGSNQYVTAALKVNGNNAWHYLTQGTHTISMTASIGSLQAAYQRILALIDEMNALGTLLTKLTSGQTDANRVWNMDAYMPDAQTDLFDFAGRIDAIYDELAQISQAEPTFANDLKYASELLRKMAKDKKRIPNNTEMLCRGDNSATTYLINVISNITNQSLSVDKFYVFGAQDLKDTRVTFFKSAVESLKRFFYSFSPTAVSKDYGISESKSNKEQPEVWVGQSVLSVGVMQQILDEKYNQKTGANIKLTVMPGEQKLILANAVGKNPDVVISVDKSVPFKFAIRGAAKNLLEYDDFLDVYTKEYTIDSLVSMFYGDGVYGAVESRDFYVTYYRKDILAALGLSVPDTWDDVEAMMPTLLRSSMNFYFPTSGSGSYALANTSPLIYQNKGEIYTADGLATALDSENTILALTQMTELYKVYGAQQFVASFFNSFRYGQIPIGISTYAMYLQLNMGAPELAGLWDIALTPGTVQEDGSVVRFQPSNATSCMIFENTDKSEQTWDFLKWWLSSETQTNYSRKRQVGYGAEYLWNTANTTAFKTLPFSPEQKKVIEEQFKWQREVTPHPASYLVEREIGNVWNNTVVGNQTLIDCINSSTILSNREIKRKLQEFGFIDEEGNLIKDYAINALEKLEALKEGK